MSRINHSLWGSCDFVNGELPWHLVESIWRFIKKKTCITCLVDENPDAITF
jgi:hypothetical protein